MFGCYRKSDANDPEIYTRAAVAVLSIYPDDVIGSVTDPATGLPSKIKWLPSIAEIKEACEEAFAPVWREHQRTQKVLSPREISRLTDAELDAQFERLGLKHLRLGSKFSPPTAADDPTTP